jgi:hypothetical protein
VNATRPTAKTSEAQIHGRSQQPCRGPLKPPRMATPDFGGDVYPPLQHVLDVDRGQSLTEPGGQPRGMPGKQLPQRRVIAAGQARDQLVVVHHPSIAPDPGQVHDQRKKDQNR